MHYRALMYPLLLVAAVPRWSEAASDQLLGIPFGARLSLSQCPTNTDKANRPCWIDRPFVYKPTGSKSGYVHLPGSERRPKWAAYAMFELMIDKSGVVQEIKVNTSNAQERHEIAESISQRFGSPFENELRRYDISWAKWRSPEGYVEMRCQTECWIVFRTPSEQAAREAELAERAKKDAARPKAP